MVCFYHLDSGKIMERKSRDEHAQSEAAAKLVGAAIRLVQRVGARVANEVVINQTDDTWRLM